MATEQQKIWRARLGHIIFESDTPASQRFDIVLLWLILLSVIVVLLESVPSIRQEYGTAVYSLEWIFTGLFTIEYVLRIWTARKPWRYVTSFYGVIDLLAILPTYLSLALVGAQYLMVVRSLRLLRIFRIFKLGRYLGEAEVLRKALQASMPKITVFLGTVLTLVIIIGSLMYLIEGADSGFSSIPISIYWAIVTLTTVGYGDISPQTPLGQMLASAVMILGYGIIAVPTGIVTVELNQAARAGRAGRSCPNCALNDHEADARYCRDCGTRLPEAR